MFDRQIAASMVGLTLLGMSQASPAAGQDLSEPAEYVGTFKEGRLELTPVSESAVEIDALAAQGTKSAFVETLDFYKSLSQAEFVKPGEVRLIELSGAAVAKTVDGAPWIDGSGQKAMEELGKWETEGLAFISVYPQGAAPISKIQTMLAPPSEAPQNSVVLAQYSEETVAGMSKARMKEIARQAAEEMFGEAAEAACNAKPRPREITPSLSVSFNFFAGAEFGISAVFDVEEVCQQLISP